MVILPKADYRFNPYQIIYDIFHRPRTNNPKIHTEPQKTQNCQSNPGGKEQSRRHNLHRLQTIVQSYSNQNSMVLAQRQTCGSTEVSREPRNKPTHQWSKSFSVHEFFKQEYWDRLPFSLPGVLPHPGVESESPVSPAS